MNIHVSVKKLACHKKLYWYHKNNAYQLVIQEIVEITNYIHMREYNPNMRENNSHIPENKPFFMNLPVNAIIVINTVFTSKLV